MGSLGVPELIIILFIVILLFGANRLPGLASGVGKAIRNFRDSSRDEGDDKKD
jgi:sec-independent protein translocase protein TatA